jgi:hypothetical protein
MRQFLWIIVKAAITITLLYLAFGRTNFDVLGERLNRLDPGWILAAIAVVGIQVLLLSVRWRAIAIHCGASLPLARSLRLTMIGVFFNQILPSTIGGDGMRIWLFARDGAGWSKATHSVLLDRFIGVLALAVMVVAGLPWALELIRDPVGRSALFVIGFGSIGASLAFIALGYIRSAWLQRWWPSRQVTQMAATMREVFASPTTGAQVIVVSLLIHVLTATIAWCAAQAVAAPFDFVSALLLIPPVILISTIPISIAGWGVRETAMVLAFGYAGLVESDGLIVSIVYGIAIFTVGIIGGIVWLASGEKLR